MSTDYCYRCLLSHPTSQCPRDAPRCLRCGVMLPLHVAGCPESRATASGARPGTGAAEGPSPLQPPLSDAEFDPLFETEQDVDGLDAVSRPPYEVTQRSRFFASKHDDCDCMLCRPWTS